MYLGLLLLTKSDPDLVSTVPNGARVYVGQPITIACTTSGTQILAWESNEYIGSGGQLAFGPGDRPGRVINSEIQDNTFAVLLRNSMVDGEPQLESRLRLTVDSKSQNFTIICRSVDQNRRDNVTYYKSGEHPIQSEVVTHIHTFCLYRVIMLHSLSCQIKHHSVL